MLRLLFEKTGNAVWISHLDLMRVFQRGFKRAGLALKHSQGFNPRPSVSIALPLSVGIESKCELLDFELDVPAEDIARRLNNVMICGVRVLDCYEAEKKIRHLTYLSCLVHLEYDDGVPENAAAEISNLFSASPLLMEKKTKSGAVIEQDIVSMIRSCDVSAAGEKELQIHAVVCCREPTLNPMQLTAAIEKYLPAFRPDFSRFERLEIYDEEMNVFR